MSRSKGSFERVAIKLNYAQVAATNNASLLGDAIAADYFLACFQYVAVARNLSVAWFGNG